MCRTDTQTHDILTPWAPVGAKKGYKILKLKKALSLTFYLVKQRELQKITNGRTEFKEEGDRDLS